MVVNIVSAMCRDYRFILIALAFLAIPSVVGNAPCAEVLTLDQAISRALQVAPALNFAAAQSDLSKAQVNAARAPLLPSLTGAAEYNNAPGYDPSISNNGLSLGQVILDYTAFDGGRRAAQLRAARYSAEAAVLGVYAARAQIVFDTTVAYYDLMRARAAEAEVESSLARLTRYVAIVVALHHSGRAIANDVLRIRGARNSAELALANAREARAHASIMLGSMIGEYNASDLAVANAATLPPPPKGQIERSPTLVAAERQVRSAQLAVQAARAERYPTLKLQLTAGYEGAYPRQTLRRFAGASYDGALSLPIFEGGLISAHIDAAKASEHAAIAQRQEVKLQLTRDLADADMRYDNARKQLAILQTSQSTADDAFALDWARFLGGGNVTLFDVLDTYQQAENLRIARFDQNFAARQASAQAALILGMAQ